MSGQYNLRNPAVKRLMKEAQELRESTEQYYAQPLEDNLFEWHFTIRGPGESEFDGGIYHGRITLPPEYPMKPPSIMLLTPNGRFETFKKICLSISGHHPESWQPSWSIRTALLAIIGFMPTHGNGAIGSLDYTADERKVLAKRSLDWKCSECGSIRTMLKPVTEASKKETEEAKELASQINFQGEKEKNGAAKKDSGEESKSSPSPPSIEAESTTATPEASAASGGTSNSTPSTPQMPNFPPFNPSMFPPNMGTPPPFMNPMMRMMTPPNSGGATPPGGATNGVLPMRPPFWPGMMPMPGSTSGNNNSNMGNTPRSPGGGMMYPWPPMMMNPMMMMNPQMMSAMMGQQRWPSPPGAMPGSVNNSATTVTTPNVTTSSTSASTTGASPTTYQSASVSTSGVKSTSTTVATTSNTASTSASISSSSSGQSAAASAQQSPTLRTGTSNDSSTTAAEGASKSDTAISSTTTASSSTTATATTTTTTPTSEATPPPSSSSTTPTTTSSTGLRQRAGAAVVTPQSTPPPAPAPAYGTADLPSQSINRGENPWVVMVMALLGLLIIALILRRLYNVINAAAFDNDF